MRLWVSILALFLTSLSATASSPGIALSMAKQDGAPVRMTQTLHGIPDLLQAASFENRSGKTITSYRIGWMTVRPDHVSFDRGSTMLVAARPGEMVQVPSQGVSAKMDIEKIVFFVDEVQFSDGSRWKADHKKIRREADSQRQS